MRDERDLACDGDGPDGGVGGGDGDCLGVGTYVCGGPVGARLYVQGFAWWFLGAGSVEGEVDG